MMSVSIAQGIGTGSSLPDPKRRLWNDSSCTGAVWNHFKSRLFLLRRDARLSIEESASQTSCVVMIICSCNILSDHDIRDAVSAADDVLRHAKQVYDCLGCSMECGRCARTIKTIIDEAVGACAHSGTAPDTALEDEFALAAS